MSDLMLIKYSIQHVPVLNVPIGHFVALDLLLFANT